MASIRGRLTVTYAAALIGTMLVFGTTLWFGRGASTQAQLERYASDQASVALRLSAVVGRQAKPGVPVPLTEIRDTLAGPRVVPQLYELLETLPDIAFLVDDSSRIVYYSPQARFLNSAAFDAVRASASDLGANRVAILQVQRDTLDSLIRKAWLARGLPLNDELLVVGRRAAPSLAPIRYVVSATSISPRDHAERQLLGSMLAIAPFVLLASIGVAYYMAGNTLRPLDRVRTELEAITDGRSLHHRLHIEDTGDELARLGATLNAMIERLQTSFGGLRRFTADASHELKTPLTVLRANVERAMSTPQGSADQLVALEEALAEITRMADLVDSLLTLARFDEGRFDLHREPVALDVLIRDVFETAMILGEMARLTILLPVCDSVTILGDAARLRQLFLNLVTNAIKYTPAGGTVELTLQRVDDLVLVGVRDTGIGIAAADLPHIFDRFWRADRARSRRALGEGTGAERGGFGLGLAISQWIAQAHGGTLTVASRLTRGSTFTVTLPALVDHGTSTPLLTGGTSAAFNGAQTVIDGAD